MFLKFSQTPPPPLHPEEFNLRTDAALLAEAAYWANQKLHLPCTPSKPEDYARGGYIDGRIDAINELLNRHFYCQQTAQPQEPAQPQQNLDFPTNPEE